VRAPPAERSAAVILTFDNVLSSDEAAYVEASLSPDDFIDGTRTAGWHARLVKHNTQLQVDDERTQAVVKLIHDKILKHADYRRAFQPKLTRQPLISRYEPGMSYGAHVDDAFMGSNPIVRADIAMTLFLSDPASYDGGELVIESTFGTRAVKLAAGAMVVYPATTLHRVEPVTRGIRLAAVSWGQSLIPDPIKREILYDLDNARRALFDREGKTPEFDLISKSLANLLRLWSDL
jgi:PKHD-type hydroxylase